MNWNGQRQWLDHAINKRYDPQNAASLQKDCNNARLKRVLDALKTRPVFIPLSFEMTAAAQTSPYRDTTPLLGYDVLITGVKSDTQTRDIIVKDTSSETSLVRIGAETNLYLRSDEFAGQGVTNGGGQLGVQYLTTPLLLNAGRRLTVEMFKTDATADAEEANIVLIGVRVSERRSGESVIEADREQIERAIALSEIPQERFLKVKFDFDSAIAGGEARNIFTPRVEEPILLRGMRTSLRYSNIELGIQGEATWTTEPVPIWAIAAEDDLVHDNWIWFSKPLYLAALSTVEIRRVVNGLYSNDATLLDSETGNTITFKYNTL